MQKFLEATGESRDAAIANALRQLGLDRDDVSVEVLDNGKKGIFGIGATPARVRVTYEAPEIIEEKKVDNKIPVLTLNDLVMKQAEEIHAFIREVISEKFGCAAAENVSILYGGSCKPSNAKELFAKPNVDGGLIGGAALKVADFKGIIDAWK